MYTVIDTDGCGYITSILITNKSELLKKFEGTKTVAECNTLDEAKKYASKYVYWIQKEIDKSSGNYDEATYPTKYVYDPTADFRVVID